MTTTVFDIKTQIALKFDEFNRAWNEKDLVTLAGSITNDVSFSNPSFHIGVFKMGGRQVYGKFDVLKFWKNYQSKIVRIEEEKVLTDIMIVGDSYIVKCDIHNHNLGVSCKGVFRFTEDLLVDRIDFSNITKLKTDKKVSLIEVQMMQFRNKFLN